MYFLRPQGAILSPYFVFPKWLLLGEAHFLGKPQKGLPEKRRTRISMGFATSKAHKRETQGKYFYLVFIILEICCFRHLEKPIKTKENKVKHFCYCCFVFICVYWFCPVFLDSESKYFKRRDAKSQSFFFFFTNTECTRFVADPLTTGK